ncbi:hypothetical protein DFA_07131 [Cavenderia fasciculata]|uniref:FUZ/MON1/HPS1 third Longin domain-containing protein n=1 Tax=Cavenderia fasciculata TaxID=261658 RepID=F4PVK1_CACFS|nr:uncharacterized protein DFA_07131 [Cavenderia fasciculata]EGG20015.1 hypothetical protein DFA_07131 [Cavenderia fasciculata]|eukprot:XP_004366998.1 hypothetical protein DFA_07131 [Cavenderia fasciculata]
MSASYEDNLSSLKDISLGSKKSDSSLDDNTSTTSTNTNNNNNNNTTSTSTTSTATPTTPSKPNPLMAMSFDENWVSAASTLEMIYFRNANATPTPIWAYCAEIQENTFLLLLNKEKIQKDTKQEIERLEASKRILYDRICKQYGKFLLVKEKTNIAISRFSHIPGLVHFILIDRTNHRIKAPTISQLNGPRNTLNVQPEDMVQFIKKRVWNMYSHCCHQLKKGYSYQVIKDKDFQYSYRLWVEDDESKEQIVERDTRIYNSRSIYSELVKRYYPQPVKCLELLTLYIGALPVSLIYKNDRVLCSLLFDKEQE